MRLLIVRHGQTDSNASGRFVTDAEGLSLIGRKQADLLAERLIGEPIDVALYSGSVRTAETLGAIRTRRPDIGVRLYPELHEGLVGAWQGQASGLREAEARRTGLPLWQVRPPGGESWEDISERVGRCLTDIRKTYADSDILIVGQGRINSLALRILSNAPWDRYSGRQQPHASLSIVQWSASTVQVEVMEDVSFLPVELRTI